METSSRSFYTGGFLACDEPIGLKPPLPLAETITFSFLAIWPSASSTSNSTCARVMTAFSSRKTLHTFRPVSRTPRSKPQTQRSIERKTRLICNLNASPHDERSGSGVQCFLRPGHAYVLVYGLWWSDGRLHGIELAMWKVLVTFDFC